MKKIITVDCDNILVDTARSFLRYYKEVYGDDVAFETLTMPYLQENNSLHKFPQARNNDAYLEYFFWAYKHGAMPLISGAKQGVQALYDAGYELHIVTGRVDEQKEITEQWIQEYFPGIFKQIYYCHDFTTKKRSKGEVCQSLGASVHIDDFYHYAESIASVGIPTLLFDNPWNQQQEDNELIVRVSGWSSILTDIDKVL